MAASNNYVAQLSLQTAAGVPFTGAAGAGTYNSGDIPNLTHRGLKLVIDITAVGGTPTLTVMILGKDPVSGKTWTILASTALAAAGTTILTVYPGTTVAANADVADALPPTFQVQAVIAGTTPTVTATIAAHFIY